MSREIDMLVAEKVMGWKKPALTNDCYIRSDCKCQIPSPYTTDIRFAWEVVEKMREDGYRFFISTTRNRVDAWNRIDKKKSRSSDSIPMSICLVALRCFGVEV